MNSYLRHRGDRNPAGDPDRLRCLVPYTRPTRLASASPGRVSRLPDFMDDGYGATVTKFELLSVDLDAAYVGIDECSPRKNGNGELFGYQERYTERRVP